MISQSGLFLIIGCNFCDELCVSKVRFIKEYWGKSLKAYKNLLIIPLEYIRYD